MIRETNFVTYWRAANRALAQRRWPALNLGRATIYWWSGFSAAQAAEAEVLRASLSAPRTLH